MILQYIFTLPRNPDHPLQPGSAYRLYAHLLEKLMPEDACRVHEGSERAISQFLYYDKKTDCCFWHLHILHPEIAAILQPVLEGLTEVTVENQTFPISGRECHTLTAEDLILQGRQEEQTRQKITFHTLTAFRQAGRYTIFPQERLILQSLILRWNEVFPQYPLEDEDAFHALLSGIHIVDYQLRSGRFSLKGTRIPGFVGYCILEARLPLPLLELWNTLLRFADFAGIGIKTGLGMGGTHTEGWTANR